MDAGIVAGLVTALPEGAEIGCVRAVGIRLRGVAAAEQALAGLAGAPPKALPRALPSIMPPATPAAVAMAVPRKPEPPRCAPKPGWPMVPGWPPQGPPCPPPQGPGRPPMPGRILAEAAGRRALRLAAAAEQAAEKAAGRARPALRLGELRLELLHAPVEVGEGLLLHEDRLRHGVGRVRLGAQPLGDQALGLGIARLVGNLLQALENIGDDLAFLIVHDRFSSGTAGRPGRGDGEAPALCPWRRG